MQWLGIGAFLVWLFLSSTAYLMGSSVLAEWFLLSLLVYVFFSGLVIHEIKERLSIYKAACGGLDDLGFHWFVDGGEQYPFVCLACKKPAAARIHKRQKAGMAKTPENDVMPPGS